MKRLCSLTKGPVLACVLVHSREQVEEEEEEEPFSFPTKPDLLCQSSCMFSLWSIETAVAEAVKA